MEVKPYGFVADENIGDVSDMTVINYRHTPVYLIVATLARA